MFYDNAMKTEFSLGISNFPRFGQNTSSSQGYYDGFRTIVFQRPRDAFFFLCEHTHVTVQCLGPLSFLINPYNEHQANDSQDRCLQGTRYINTPTGLLARVKKATNPNQSHNFLFFSRVITKLFFFLNTYLCIPWQFFFSF